MTELIWRSLDVEGVQTWYQDGGKHNGIPLIFIHGMACDSTFWRWQFPAFTDRYRVIAVDLPGHGRSARPHDRVYSMDFFARSVRKVVEREQLSMPVLIGHSMGFAVSRRYLLQYPGWARAVCSVDGFYFRRPLQARGYQIWSSIMRFLRFRGSAGDPVEQGRKFIEYTFYKQTPESVRQEVRTKTYQADPYVILSSWREMIRPANWAKCRFMLPALLLYCRAPHTLPDQQWYFGTCFPRMRYVEWDDAGHYPMLEQPARFNTELQRFLDDMNII